MLQFLKKLVRVIWTLLTYPVAVVAGIPGAIAGLAWGIAVGLGSERGVRMSARAGLQIGLIKGVRDTFSASTWLFKRIFLRREEQERFPSFDRPQREVLIVGHRGAPYKNVENTLGSFRRALKEGANALEIDLCITRDNEVVVWHDWNPDSPVAHYRENGLEACQAYRPFYPNNEFRRPVCDLSLDELRLKYGYARKDGTPVPDARGGNNIPTFTEFMYWAVQRKQLSCVFLDTKIPKENVSLVKPFLDGIAECRARFSPKFELVLLSPYPAIVEEIKRLRPDWEVSLDREIVDALPLASEEEAVKYSAIRLAEKYGNHYASIGRPTVFTLAPFDIYKKIVLADLAYRHEHCLDTRLIAWTVNDAKEMAELLEMGVDGILTDYPYRLHQLITGLPAKHLSKTLNEWMGLSNSKSSNYEI